MREEIAIVMSMGIRYTILDGAKGSGARRSAKRLVRKEVHRCRKQIF